MQYSLPFLVLLASGASRASGDASTSNPIAKVLELIDELASKIAADGEKEDQMFNAYKEWCDDASANLQNEIKTSSAKKDKLEAKISELTSSIEDAVAMIEDLAGRLSKNTEELDEATAIRAKEAKDFKASEAELVDVVDTIARAIDIISREMAKTGASFSQIAQNNGSLRNILHSLTVISDAAAFPAQDGKKLAAFLQSQQADAADDGELGAPAAATYKSQSGGILDTLEDMKEKAESQLSELRKAETNSKHNFAMLKQALEDKMANDKKDMDTTKNRKAEDEEAKAAAEGDLAATNKDLAMAVDKLKESRFDCIKVAADHERSIQDRAEELKTIAEAKKIIIEATGGAASFMQISATAGSNVVDMVKRLAREHHSAALAQLSSRIDAALRMGTAGGSDPFAKVKALITSMIAKLESEGKEDAEEKAFCDEQMAKTEAKKSELEDDEARLNAKIEQYTAKSSDLKEQVEGLQAELATLAREQEEMNNIRNKQHAVYLEQKADTSKALTGTQKAISLLQDYYASKNDGASFAQGESSSSSFFQQPAKPISHSKSSASGGGIIDILQVAESDFARQLADLEAQESDEQTQHDEITQANVVSKTEKDQGVKYMTQEYKGLDTAIGDMSGDLATVVKELSAVNEYYTQIKGRCVAKPESYAERKARREAEIAGLKQALSILETETAFVQRQARVRSLRGSRGVMTP